MQTSTGDAVRLLIVDDHEVVRAGLRMLLKRWPNIEVVGEAGTAEEGIAETQRIAPDVVLMDMRLPDASGVDACREIRANTPHSKIVFLTAFADEDAVLAAIFAGADGYLLKEIAGEALVSAIESVARGQSILDPAITRAVLDGMRSMSLPAAGPKDSLLSPQEQHVLALVAEGKTNKEIATSLNLSVYTIEAHRGRLMEKLNLHSSGELVRFAVRNGLID